ncbi:MAG TPA: bifunctional tetrahydrofolate synthase/dihydrofolate synthase [Methylophilaceae bacterium]
MNPESPLPQDLAGWLRHIEAQHPKSISMGLERVAEVRRRLGLEPRFPVIIVGGTNGKGSTCAMLECIYRHAGYRVAGYSSPHLIRYNERVRINGQELDDAALVAAFAAVEAARQDILLTYFEYGTLAAMWCFVQQGVDLAVLEVGLGGRLDAVNVFEPDCAVVTAVDIDHIEFLGSSRAEIGLEKAGIFRAGVPAVCGDRNPPETLMRHAADIGADLRLRDLHFRPVLHNDGWDFEGAARWPALPFPALRGEFQLDNASCALATIEAMQERLPVQREAIESGLRSVHLAGRFQTVSSQPQILLDVAHNPHAAHALAHNLRHSKPAGKTLGVLGMLADKDIAGVISVMRSEIDRWYLSSVDHMRSASTTALLDVFRGINVTEPYAGYENLAAALRQACLDAGKNDRIIAFGSFFTVAEIMQALPATVASVSR